MVADDTGTFYLIPDFSILIEYDCYVNYSISVQTDNDNHGKYD